MSSQCLTCGGGPNDKTEHYHGWRDPADEPSEFDKVNPEFGNRPNLLVSWVIVEFTLYMSRNWDAQTPTMMATRFGIKFWLTQHDINLLKEYVTILTIYRS